MLTDYLKSCLRGDRAYGLPFYIVTAIALLVMIAAFWSPLLDQDEMIYALVASELLDGKLPYQGVFDHKPVGIYYIYALFFSLFGETYIAIRVLASSMLIGTAVSIYFALKNLQFGQAARIAATTFCLAFPIGLDGLSGNTEGIQTFLLAVLFYLSTCITKQGSKYQPIYLLAFGAVVALGFSVNYLFSLLALLAFISLLIFISLRKFDIKTLIFHSLYTFFGFVIGNILIFSPYLIDLLSGGSLLSEYFADQQKFLSGYGVKSVDKRIIIDKFFFWVIPFIPILIGGAFTFFYLDKQKWLCGIFAVSTFSAACVAASASLFFFNHYWVLATVPLALFAATAIDHVKDIQARHIFRYGLAFILLFYMLSGTGRIVNHLSNSGGERELRSANEFIQKHIGEDDFVVSISVSPVYVFLNRLNTEQKYHFQGHVEQLNDGKALDGDQYFLDLLNEEPGYVLVDPMFCKDIRAQEFSKTCQYLENKFTLAASFAGIRPVAIYKAE